MNELQRAVSQFHGKTPDQIADMVAKRGIKGRMGTTYRCPMALLLDGENTGTFVIGRRFIARQSGTRLEKVRTPDSVAAFVRKFDLGQYPQLIAPPPRCTKKPGSAPAVKGKASGKSGLSKPRAIRNHTAKLVGRFNP